MEESHKQSHYQQGKRYSLIVTHGSTLAICFFTSLNEQITTITGLCSIVWTHQGSFLLWRQNTHFGWMAQQHTVWRWGISLSQLFARVTVSYLYASHSNREWESEPSCNRQCLCLWYHLGSTHGTSWWRATDSFPLLVTSIYELEWQQDPTSQFGHQHNQYHCCMSNDTFPETTESRENETRGIMSPKKANSCLLH